MRKRTLVLSLLALAVYFIVYVYFSSQKMNLLGDITSPIGTFGATVILFYVFLKTRSFRDSWLVLSIGTLIWTIADIWWAVCDIILKTDPEKIDLLMFLYLLTNVCISVAIGIFFFQQRKKWHRIQLGVDTLATLFTGLGLIWILIFDSSASLLFSASVSNVTSTFSLMCNFFTVGIILIWYISSTRQHHLSHAGLLLLAGVFLYSGTNIFYFFQVTHLEYTPNSLIDVLYLGALMILTATGLFTIYNPETISDMLTTTVKEKSGSLKRIFLFVIPPLMVIVFSGFRLAEILFFCIVAVLYQLTSVYVQGAMKNEQLLEQEKKLNDRLEMRIAERTQALIAANQDLEVLSQLDAVTGLSNRRYFLEELDHALAGLAKDETLALYFMDLDRFKAINDSYGHDMGDKVLIEIANRLNLRRPHGAMLGRLGGDEFVLAWRTQMTPDEHVETVSRIITQLSKPVIISPYQFHVTVSVGISLYPQDSKDRSMLLKNADIAMYHAKAIGSNQFVFFNSFTGEKVQRRNELELMLRKADFGREFVLYYQPQFAIPEGRLVGVEALIRWKYSDQGMIFPDEFIPITEETGLIVPMGEWIMREAMRQISEWNRVYGTNIKMGINLSVKQLNSIGFLDMLHSCIQQYDIHPEWIDLEITESNAMKSDLQVEELFSQIAATGVAISIDDFGTGYSSLSYIQRFSIDRLKIAKPLIDNITTGYGEAQIVNAIIMMAKAMGIMTIAEGVEDEKQLKALTRMGCDEIQGYYYSRPIPADEFENKYLKGKRV